VKIHGQPIPALLENLKHPVDGVRYRTRIELSARETSEVLAATTQWVKQFDPRNPEHAHHLLEALWLHQQHNVKNPDLLATVLASPEPHARQAALVVQHMWYTADLTGGGEVAKDILEQKPDSRTSDPAKGIFYISCLIEKMSYDTKEITVKAGQEITLTLINPDFMPHNLLVVEPGATEEIGTAAMAMGAEGFAKGFRPDNPKIIAGTKMLDNGQEDTIKFTAPATPGKYEFLCTFPGHWVLMRGTMNVK